MRPRMIGRLILVSAAVAPLGVGFLFLKQKRDAQRQARTILGPGEPETIVKVLKTLRKFEDSESTRLVQQLEERLRSVDRDAWREYQQTKPS